MVRRLEHCVRGLSVTQYVRGPGNFQAHHQGLTRTNELRPLLAGNLTKNQHNQTAVRYSTHHSWTERLGPWVEAGGVTATYPLHAQTDSCGVEDEMPGVRKNKYTRPHREDTLHENRMGYKRRSALWVCMAEYFRSSTEIVRASKRSTQQ